MDSYPVSQTCIGTAACVVNVLAAYWASIFPALTAIGAIAGSLVAIHGLYLIIKGYVKAYLKRKHNSL